MMFSEKFLQYAGAAFDRRLPLLGDRGIQIQKAMEETQEEERALLQCYYGSMPLSDAFQYDFALLRAFAAHAVWLRKRVEWCRRLPEDIFLQHVAYYRINSEAIVDCRAFFCGQVMPLIREWAGDCIEELPEGMAGMEGAALAERVERSVLEINYWCASQASYESTDLRTQSPLSVYRSGSGRCGEESTFLVTVLRSVGIAARQVYVPRWAHCDDNHAWVEVHVDGKWHFLGACEPEEMLDRGWFTHAASRALLVYARTFLPYGLDAQEQEAGRDGCVSFVNVTERYTQVRQVQISVRGEKGEAVPGAKVEVQILNMAEWASVAWLETDGQGCAQIRIGRGDFLLKAQKEGRTGWRLCRKEETQVCVSLEAAGAAAEGPVDQKGEGSLSCLEAPADRPVSWPVPDRGQKERRRKRLEEAEERRTRKLEEARRRLGELREEAAERLGVSDQGLSGLEAGDRRPIMIQETARKRAERIIREKAGCNGGEIGRFLSGKNWRRERLELLSELSDKDFRDLCAQVLEQHVEHSASRQAHIRLGRNEKGEAVWGRSGRADYAAYCLNPRIDREELTAYRQEIDAFLAKEEKENGFPGQEAPGFRGPGLRESELRKSELGEFRLRESFCSRPERIWEWIETEIRFDPSEDYETLLPSPAAVLCGRWGGAEGQRVLFAGICRTLGIPARINPVTGEAEYLEYTAADCPCEGAWICVSGPKGAPEEMEKAAENPRLVLDMREEKDWIYHQTWTLGRWNGEDYETLDYGEIRPECGRLILHPSPGAYRLIISSRMPNGNQYVQERLFALEEGEERRIEMCLYHAEPEDMLVKNPLPDLSLQSETGEEALGELLAGRRSLLIFLETGQEPTEHVLNELLERAGRGCRDRGRDGERLQILAVTAGREEWEYPLLAELKRRDPSIRLYSDSGMEQAELLARRMYAVPGQLPLLIAVDEAGNGIYASSGYNVGSVELAGKLLDEMRSGD